MLFEVILAELKLSGLAPPSSNLAPFKPLHRGNGNTTTYDYDAAGRLEELAHNLASTDNDVTFNFTYSASSQAVTNNRTTSNSGYVAEFSSPAV